MSIVKTDFIRGIRLTPDNVSLSSIEGEFKVDSADSKFKAYLGAAVRAMVTEDQTQTLTNKTIDVDNNTISNIEVDNLKSGVLNTSTSLATASNTQIPSALAVKTYVDDSIATVNEASEISYNNATSGLSATNVQAAIDEQDVSKDALVSLSGVALNATNLGTFTGSTIPDNQTNKQALQALETSLEEVDQNVNDLITLSGVAENSTDLGTFTGTTIPDNQNNKQALQALETAVETKAASSVVSEIDQNVDDLITLSGVAENATNLGTFTGTTIADNSTVKVALQALETSVETKATGAASSTDEAIARFDSTTGKILQNSVVTIDDAGIMSGATQLNVDNLRMDGNVVSSTDTNGNLDLTPNGTGIINANKDARFFQDVAYQISTDNATGSNATLTAPSTKIIRLTNASLASIDMIPAGSQGQQITLINATGVNISINNDIGGTSANRILTGEKTAVTMKDEASFLMEYDSTEQRWMIVGSSASGGGSSNNNSYEIGNLGIATSVGSNALTIALKTAAGINPSAGDYASVGFRNSTATTGQYSIVNITGALSLVVSSGSTLGQLSATAGYLYVYLINNSGTAELAVSSVIFDDGSLVSTTAEGGAGAADSASAIYSTTARSNVPCRLVGRILQTQTTAGTWTSAGAEVSVMPFQKKPSCIRINTSNGYGSSNTKIPRFSNVASSTGSAITYTDSSTAGSSFTINEPGEVSVSFNMDFGASGSLGISLNSSELTTNIGDITSANRLALSQTSGAGFTGLAAMTFVAAVGDVVRPHTAGAAANTNARTNFTITHKGN